MQFEYDEEGATFYNFLFSIVTLVIIPCTYYCWPSKDKNKQNVDLPCKCFGCISKNDALQQGSGWTRFSNVCSILFIILGWAVLIFLGYKISTIQTTVEQFDPYGILNLEQSATTEEIRKRYRELSKVYHPDRKGGDEEKFMLITKALKALTDETARENWDLYNDPDGPKAMKMGIALPKFLVDDEYSGLVIGVYAMVFMLLLPLGVGIWWNNTIKFNQDSVLRETNRLYQQFFFRHPAMTIDKIIQLLSFSREFGRQFNRDIKPRETDGIDIPKLLKELNVKSKINEFAFIVKARALIYAHLHRHPMPRRCIHDDKMYIIKSCMVLTKELINIGMQFTQYCVYEDREMKRNRIPGNTPMRNCPRLSTIENIMLVQQMIVQAVSDKRYPLLQLPHIDEALLRSGRRASSLPMRISAFARMNDEKRRRYLYALSSSQYEDVLNVLGRMPNIKVDYECRVVDEADVDKITCNALVRMTVELVREPMSTFFDDNQQAEEDADGEQEGNVEEVGEEQDSDQKSPKPTQKQQPAKKKKGHKNKGRPPPRRPQVNPQQSKKKSTEEEATSLTKNGDSQSRQESGDDEEDEDKPNNVDDDKGDEPDDENDAGMDDPDKDPDAWERYLKKSRKESVLESRSTKSHSVHAPYFPSDKQEYWWVYLCDRTDKNILQTAPVLITDLVDVTTVDLHFTPREVGTQVYYLCVRSDSYLDVDVVQKVKIEVLPPVEFLPPNIIIPEIEDEEEPSEVDSSDDDAA